MDTNSWPRIRRICGFYRLEDPSTIKRSNSNRLSHHNLGIELRVLYKGLGTVSTGLLFRQWPSILKEQNEKTHHMEENTVIELKRWKSMVDDPLIELIREWVRNFLARLWRLKQKNWSASIQICDVRMLPRANEKMVFHNLSGSNRHNDEPWKNLLTRANL